MMSKRTQIGQTRNAALNLWAYDVTQIGTTHTTNDKYNSHWKMTNCGPKIIIFNTPTKNLHR